MAERRVYRVIFFQQGEVYEVYAKQVSHGSLFGFVELEGLLRHPQAGSRTLSGPRVIPAR